MRVLKDTLPDTLHELIAHSLADLRACRADDRYVIDMDVAHIPDTWQPDQPGNVRKCAICLAGAVLAKTVKVPISMKVIEFCSDQYYTPENWPLLEESIRNKLQALDRVRRGNLTRAIINFYGDNLKIPTFEYATKIDQQKFHGIIYYRKESFEDFENKMLQRAAVLKEQNI